MSTQRVVMSQAFPQAYRAIPDLERANRSGPLEARLHELVRTAAIATIKVWNRFAISTRLQSTPPRNASA